MNVNITIWRDSSTNIDKLGIYIYIYIYESVRKIIRILVTYKKSNIFFYFNKTYHENLVNAHIFYVSSTPLSLSIYIYIYVCVCVCVCVCVAIVCILFCEEWVNRKFWRICIWNSE